MIHTLVGKNGFRRGMDLYIGRHDNHAVTIEDFVAAMQDASGVDLGRFRRWYEQAGTPEVTIEDRWDRKSKSYELSVAQKARPTPGQAEKLPMLIPLAMGLLGRNGTELPTRLEAESESVKGTRVLALAEARETFRFVEVPEPPVPSLLRGFSAPVKLKDVPLDRLLTETDSPFLAPVPYRGKRNEPAHVARVVETKHLDVHYKPTDWPFATDPVPKPIKR